MAPSYAMSSVESSPDPLASSLGRRSAPPRKPLQKTNTNARKSEGARGRRGNGSDSFSAIDVSPSKSVIMHTPRTAGSSPWKIRVTVEPHEDGTLSDQENIQASPTPARRPRTTTTTTTVPLKGADESSPVKRRGRPRKSDVDVNQTGKRSSTPARKSSKARKSTSTDRKGTKEGDLGQHETVQPKRGRGRPRKSVTTTNEPQEQIQPSSIPAVEATDSSPTAESSVALISTINPEPEEPQRRRRGRPRKSLASPIEQRVENGNLSGNFESLFDEMTGKTHASSPSVVIEDPMPLDEASTTEQSIVARTTAVQSTGASHAQEPKTSDAGRVKVRDFASMTPLHVKHPLVSEPEPEQTPEINPLRYRVPTPVKPQGWNEEDLSPLPESSPVEYEEPTSPTASTTGRSGNVSQSRLGEDFDNTSIIESEGFSMVSVDSLPSRQINSSPPAQIEEKTTTSSHTSQPTARNLTREFTDQSYMKSSPPNIIRSQRTPSLPIPTLTIPPPIETQQLSPRSASTPKLARVVRAGIALQGVVDVSKQVSSGQKSPFAVKNRLDNLFSGFGEGTRRELQAGLRLGEELARRSRERSTSRNNSPMVQSAARFGTTDDVFQTQQAAFETSSNLHRLPTPEESGEEREQSYSLSLPSPTTDSNVKYPSLSNIPGVQHIPSPGTGSEMDWTMTTPPPADVPSSMGWKGKAPVKDINLDHKEVNPQHSLIHEDMASGMSGIWEEEASRSSDLLPDAPVSQPVLLKEDDLLDKPRRSKLPRTWRRKSASDFNYSDEVEPSPSQAETREDVVNKSRSSSGSSGSSSEGILGTVEDEPSPHDDDDDTGLFWQHNMPAVFNRNTRNTKRQAKKLDLSELLGITNSPLRSSPVHTLNRLSPFKSPAPILKPARNLPPQRNLYNESSPLKHVSFANVPFEDSIDDSEISEAPSESVASDVQQLQAEMEFSSKKYGFTAALGVPNILGDKDISRHDETPLIQRSSISRLTVSPIKRNNSLFSQSTTKASTKPTTAADESELLDESEDEDEYEEEESSQISDPSSAPSGFFSRFTRTLWSALAGAPAPPRHFILDPYPPIPSQHPWTKTHFISLHNLFQVHKADASIFAPDAHPTNAALLNSFAQRKKYIGAVFSSWGYTVTITPEHLVMAKVLMQTMTVRDAEEYERVLGKPISWGEMNEDDLEIQGEITEEHVVLRLFGVVAGEMLREDEGRGARVDRRGGLEIEFCE